MSEDKDKKAEGYSFTLEDILAEYKGDAYIAGEKKLPVDVMQKRADEIVREANTENKDTGETEEAKEPENEIIEPEIEELEIKEPEKKPEKKSRVTIIPFEEFEKYKNERDSTFDEVTEDLGEEEEKPKKRHRKERKAEPADTEAASTDIENEPEEEDNRPSKPRRGLFGRGKKKAYEPEEYDAKSEEEPQNGEDANREEEPEADEIPEDEPAIKDIYRAYSIKAQSLRIRSIIAAAVCILMALLTIINDTNTPLSGLLTGKYIPVVIALLAMELIVTGLGFDIIISGLKDILRLKAGAESLVTLSVLASIADAAVILFTRSTDRGTPFCAVAACSMFFSLWGAFKTARGYMFSFRSAVAVSEMYCVTAEDDRLEGGAVLVKSEGGPEGFVTKSHGRGLPEKALAIASPILILGSLGLSILASFGNSNSMLFSRCFAAIAAVSAPFSALLIFGYPFKALAMRLSESGAAIAGYEGACDIGNAVGAVVRDDDLFPAGALSISGVNIMTGASREKVLSYTGSMIIMSGSGLKATFEELLKNQRLRAADIEDFTLYEGGGFSGNVGIDRILVGSSGFMNLMGVRIQENMNIKNAVFCAINGTLSGTFIVEYNPTRSVQNALVALLSLRMLTLFALRDFNISTMMLRQKFHIPAGRAENMDVLTYTDRYRLSDPPLRRRQPAALIFREGLGPYANVVLGGRSLQTAVRIGTAITLLGAVLGIVLMFLMCYKGAFSAATAANTLIFMLAWLLPTFFLSRIVSRS